MPLPHWLTLSCSLEFLSLLGMLVAIIPAWVFNQRMKQAHRIATRAASLARSVQTADEKPALAPVALATPETRASEAEEKIRQWAIELAGDLRTEAETWKPWHARCLLAAFILSIVPQFVKIFL